MKIIDIITLKKYIANHNKIEEILLEIGCHSVQFHANKQYFTAGQPDGDNKSSIVIYSDEYLRCKAYTRKISDIDDDNQDLLTLVTYILRKSNPKHKLKDTIIYLHNLLNIPYTNSYKKPKQLDEDKEHPLDIFRKVRKRRKSCNVEDLEVHGEEILDEFIPLPHIELIREGIMPWTCKEFNIGYAPNKKRHIIPHRLWSGDRNSFVGLIGRTSIKEYAMLDIPKYFPLKAYSKSMNLYGLNENYEYIQSNGYTVLVESEKSVLKRHSRNDKTLCALMCHDISPEQIRILISLDTEIVIAMDKDVDLNHVRAMCSRFYGIRRVSYIWDKHNLLKEKDSPADLPNKLYEFLFKHRVSYDESEHRQYLKSLNKTK